MKRWKAWGYAAGLFVLHKLVVWGGSLLFALQQHSPTPLLPFLKFAVIQNFTRWDSLWYIGIAAHGYRRTSAAFFPLFPFLIQQVHQWTGFSYQSSGWIIANVSFFLALWMLARLFLLDQNQSAAWRALLLLVLFPTAFFFSCAYTEPLFLFWTAGSLYFARTRKFWLSGIFGFFASLTRNTGVVLVLPFLYEYFRARDFRWTRIREDVLAVLMIPGGLAVYMGLLYHTLGDPLAFVHAQEFWKRSFHWPWETLWYGTRELWVKPLRGWSLFIRAFTVCVVYAELVFLALPLLIPRLRIPVSYYLFALGSVVVPLLSPSRDWYFLSISRFALVLFPLFFIAAKTFRSRWLFLTVAGASVAGLLFCLANFSKGYFVA